MSEREFSDLAEAMRIIVDYARGKGQLPRLDRFIIFWVGLSALSKIYNVPPREIIDLDKLVHDYSINAPAIERPLWLHVIENMSKLSTKTEIITQVAKRKPLE